MPGYWWTKYYRKQRFHRPSVSVSASPERNDQLTGILDIGLQVLDNVIVTKWKVLPRDQCQGEVVHYLSKILVNRFQQASEILLSTSSSKAPALRKALEMNARSSIS